MSSSETSSDDGETSHNLNIKKKKIAGRRRVRNAARTREKIIADQEVQAKWHAAKLAEQKDNTCQQVKCRAAKTSEKKLAEQKDNTCQQVKCRAAKTPEKKLADREANNAAKSRAAKTPEQIINVVDQGIKY